jgi:cytochrome c-type biogenesis protein CcmH
MQHLIANLLAAALLTAGANVGVCNAGDFSPEVEHEAGKVFGSVMSPFCPGKLIGDCPSPAAVELRETIRERVQAGESADTIRAELYDTYGEALRAAPTGKGFDLLAWLVPPVLIALCALAILVWIRRRRTDPSTTAGSLPELDAKSRARVEAALAEPNEKPSASR